MSNRFALKIFFGLICLLLYSFTSRRGLIHQHITTDVPQSIHVLEVDPEKFSIVAAKALDKCVGRETVLSIAKRKGALVAINGGFFDVGGCRDGCPCGILKIDRNWYGLPAKPRGAIGWKDKGEEVIFDRVLTHLDGIDFYIDPQTDSTTSADWEEMEHVIGGAPLLIQNSKRMDDFSTEKILDNFLNHRHARTAVGLLPNGNWIFVIVDGRRPTFSVGMTIEELSCFMEALGCVSAINLDGGGSSTLVYDGQVINQPTGDGDAKDKDLRVLRPVSDAILIFLK